MFSNTLSLCSSLNVRNQVSVDKIIVEGLEQMCIHIYIV
jgi:hypothetical protein